MVPGELLVEQAYHVSERTYRERSSRMALEPGDVIYSREGERLGIASPVGDVTVCMGQRVMALRHSSETAPSFLMFEMNTERSEEYTYELQSLMRISYAVLCW